MTDTNATTPAQTPKRRFSGVGGVLVTLLGLAFAGLLVLFVGTTVGLRLDNNCFSWDNWGETQTICFTDLEGEDLLIPPARKDGDSAPAEAEAVDEEEDAVPAPAHVVDDDATPVRAIVVDEPEAEIILASSASGTVTTRGEGDDYYMAAPSGQAFAGVFIPEQNPIVDAIAARENADRYFMPMWRMYREGKIPGASARVTVFLTRGGETVYTAGTFDVNGHLYISFPRSELNKGGTHLCVQVPWAIIAHQKVAGGPGRDIMCERLGDTYRGDVGKGKSPARAHGVIAIAPAGI